MIQGKLRLWRGGQGYGIVRTEELEGFFLHVSNIVGGPEPTTGCLVQVEPAPPYNKWKYRQAVNAVIVDPKIAMCADDPRNAAAQIQREADGPTGDGEVAP